MVDVQLGQENINQFVKAAFLIQRGKTGLLA
jgi:hypothetical protein